MVEHTQTLSTLAAIALLTTAVMAPRVSAQDTGRVLVEGFENYAVGEAPYHWKAPNRYSRELIPSARQPERDDDYFEVVEEDGRRVVRAYTSDETVQIARENGDGYTWDIHTHPVLAWEWRAERLPKEAREDNRKLNDTGAAVYVLFDCGDWLGRACTLKYSYSSTLPVGTTVRYGRLHVVVVASAKDGIGTWQRIARNVVDDYERLFGAKPPAQPRLVILWSDSDTTHGVSEVYFDTVEVLGGMPP